MGGSLDTNVLIRLTLNDVPEQRIAVEALLDSRKIYAIADAALFEVVFVLEKVYSIPRKQVAKSMFAIIRNPQFNCNRKLFELVLPIYEQHKKLSIVDCALSQYALLNNTTPLFTFDIELAKAIPEQVTLIKNGS